MPKFTDDDIRRSDLPRDVFELLHDLAYDHKRNRIYHYRLRAQKILSGPPISQVDAELKEWIEKRDGPPF